jgi:sialic acid synthase SpsE/mannose-6-phosphate isomerase-like protein (cupin superfamily)
VRQRALEVKVRDSLLGAAVFDRNSKPLFVFEMANNHMGDMEHGLRIVREMAAVAEPFRSRFDFAFKLQYRDLDTLIHSNYRNRLDLKYIKRFNETRLSEDQFLRIKDEMVRHGFLTLCTPFDEPSVDLIEKHGFDGFKVASCSLTDWPLLERLVRCDKPVIASTAGSGLQEIDNVVSFFDHRSKTFALMHCVAEYPTPDAGMQLNQIELFRQRYPQVRIGFSTHERPDRLDPIKLAVAKGASIFEKHVGVATERYPLNDYSANPAQVSLWLRAAADAYALCGVGSGRCSFTEKELASLHSLRRGLFARRAIKAGEQILPADLLLAMPTVPEQYTANDLSKYAEFFATTAIDANQPLLRCNVRYQDHRNTVYAILQEVKGILRRSHAAVPRRIDFEISHHYGIHRFHECGATIINFVNRDYCKKLIALLPGQEHPEQYHKLKEETFQILYGDIELHLDGEARTCGEGEIITIARGVRHRFLSRHGAVIEEISSKHFPEDSYYTDPDITANKARKTLVTYWVD